MIGTPFVLHAFPGTCLPSHPLPSPSSAPAGAWAPAIPRIWWWRLVTPRSGWGRARRKRRGAAWSSSPRSEKGRARWTANGWGRPFFFPIGRRDGQVTSRVGRKHQRKMSRAMTLPLHDLCLPLAVKEAGVPQWHQPVWAQSGKRVTDQRQL